jgi:hypothetical protein
MLKYAVIAGILCLLAAVGLLAGCANTIYAPEQPAETRKLYLLDVGRHTRLAFGLPDGEFIEYGYGEWLWYARMEDSWWRVPAVLFWPTQGTLGRRQWHGPQAEARLLAEYENLNVLALAAEEGKVAALVTELDLAFMRESTAMIRNRVYGLDFVPFDRSYWLLNNSNHAVKEWLERAGFDVRGSGIFARWRLAEADP